MAYVLEDCIFDIIKFHGLSNTIRPTNIINQKGNLQLGEEIRKRTGGYKKGDQNKIKIMPSQLCVLLGPQKKRIHFM